MSSYNGGGVYCWGVLNTSDCTINGNTSYDYGGGIELVTTNCIITGNMAYYGGGISCSHPSTIISCTITRNSAFEGGGIYCQYTDSLSTITNSILWSNTPDEIYAGISALVTYSDIRGGYTGEGNIDMEPLFVDSDAGDYHLQFSSPCIDVGTDKDAPNRDRDGILRPQDGDNDGSVNYDMGAYEYINSSPKIMPISDKKVKIGKSLQFSVIATDPEGYALTNIVIDLPSGARFDPNTQIFSWKQCLPKKEIIL